MSRFQPALLGGLFIGILSSLPIVGSANACCCLWVIIGGLLTVYLQQQNRATPVESSEAALQGLLAGAIGGVLYVVMLAVLLSGAAGLGLAERLRAALDQNPQVPPEVRDTLLSLFTGGWFPVLVAAFTIPMYAVFSMIGALLGLTVFKKKTPPAPQA